MFKSKGGFFAIIITVAVIVLAVVIAQMWVIPALVKKSVTSTTPA